MVTIMFINSTAEEAVIKVYYFIKALKVMTHAAYFWGCFL